MVGLLLLTSSIFASCCLSLCVEHRLPCDFSFFQSKVIIITFCYIMNRKSESFLAIFVIMKEQRSET